MELRLYVQNTREQILNCFPIAHILDDRNEHFICDSSLLFLFYLFPMSINNVNRQKETRKKKLSVSEICRRKR